ncbi:ATP-binding protein [Chitinivorax sp. PXF-14]|uniref:ATP-binding protein n=1 Tax=Chitinivorax sp. PXF-14 TaxID=3230488 RepID=UPI00346750B8
MNREPDTRLQPGADTQFRLYGYAAVVGLMQQAVEAMESLEAVGERFPFLISCINELARFGLAGVELQAAPQHWRRLLQEWERSAGAALPLSRLAACCGLDGGDLVVLAGAALVEQDMRFGAVFAALHGIADEPWPTLAMLDRWAEPQAAEPPPRAASLMRRGLLLGSHPGTAQGGWCARLPPLLLQALRGDIAPGWLAAGLEYQPVAAATRLDGLVLAPALRAEVGRLQQLLAEQAIDSVLLRGPQGNGRRSLVAALAAEQGLGTLLLDDTGRDSPGRDSPGHASLGRDGTRPGEAPPPALLAALSALLGAVPVWRGGTLPAPLPGGWQACLLGPHGGLGGQLDGRCAVLSLPIPPRDCREQLWALALPELPAAGRAEFAERRRLVSGGIVRLARAAATQARLAGRALPSLADLLAVDAGLDQGPLDTLAQRLTPAGDWSRLVVNAATGEELQVLEIRCRHRESLQLDTQDHAGCGVRALLRGPSGTGKTLAARLLASSLQLPLYRVDLAQVVSKYVGETEKQLARLFDRAEALDAILLFDEGDALFGRRTAVSSANDRYANLETNFLLQRLESHEGIVLVTTNLGDNIDGAFQRRMDIVVDFALPDHEARRAIWALHLPAGHTVAGRLLDELAWRCQLSGGQIRNAAQHARLLALAGACALDTRVLLAAVQREYRKAGGVCPLREEG